MIDDNTTWTWDELTQVFHTAANIEWHGDELDFMDDNYRDGVAAGMMALLDFVGVRTGPRGVAHDWNSITND